MRHTPIAIMLLSLPGAGGAQTYHRLPATPETVSWGYYWAERAPVLRVRSGDTVAVHTMITNRPDRLRAAGVPADQIEPSLEAIVNQVADRGPGGHILTGPVFVEGALPGHVLEVRILSITLPLDYGYNGCSGYMREQCAGERTRIIPLDRERMVAPFAPGIEIPLAPFFGSMGVAPPAAYGRWSSNPPWIHAGNIDNRELVAGTTLFIPVHVPGALFSIGDGHAAQGHGEVNQTAIETSLRGEIQLIVRDDLSLTWPRAETSSHFLTMGMDPDLDRATQIAVANMIDFIVEHTGLPRGEAYRLASIAADLKITQLVDGYVGVHMALPKTLFVSPEPT